MEARRVGKRRAPPLYLANKQQASKEAFLLSALSIAPPHGSALYSTLAILPPRWWPCQIQVLSQKLTGGALGGGGSAGVALLILRILCPKTALFFPKRPRNSLKTSKARAVATLHVRLDGLVTESPVLPRNSTICPRNSQKVAKNCLNGRRLCQMGPKPRTGRILGYVAQNPIWRAPSPPAAPHLLWFPSLNIAQRDA